MWHNASYKTAGTLSVLQQECRRVAVMSYISVQSLGASNENAAFLDDLTCSLHLGCMKLSLCLWNIVNTLSPYQGNQIDILDVNCWRFAIKCALGLCRRVLGAQEPIWVLWWSTGMTETSTLSLLRRGLKNLKPRLLSSLPSCHRKTAELPQITPPCWRLVSPYGLLITLQAIKAQWDCSSKFWGATATGRGIGKRFGFSLAEFWIGRQRRRTFLLYHFGPKLTGGLAVSLG